MKTQVFAYLHTHWDREWYKSFQEFRLRLLDVTDIILEELATHAIDIFTFDGQTIVLEDYLALRPEHEASIRNFVTEGRLIVGPWYVLPDEFLVTGESLIRNLLIGHKIANQFGKCSKVGYIPDTFGHCWDIPRIMKGFNINNSVIWRGVNQQKSLFKWMSPDQSSLLTLYLFKGYAQDHFYTLNNREDILNQLTSYLREAQEYTPTMPLLLPVGGDHLAPPTSVKEYFKNFNDSSPEFHLEQGSIEKYIQSLNPSQLDELPVSANEQLDNTYAYLLPGVWSTRLYLKQLNGKTFQLLDFCERLLTMNQFTMGCYYPHNELNYAWKLYIQNHAHDSICGCSTDVVHADVENRFYNTLELGMSLLKQNIYKLSKQVQKNDIVILNPFDHFYTGPVELKTYHPLDSIQHKQVLGREIGFPPEKLQEIRQVPLAEDLKYFTQYILWAENLPPHSFSTISPAEAQKDLLGINSSHDEASPDFMDNGLIQIKIQENGLINLLDQETGKTYEHLHEFMDVGDKGDSYNFGPVHQDTPIPATFIKSKILYNGPILFARELTYGLSIPQGLTKNRQKRSAQSLNMTIKTIVTIFKGCKRVEFKTEFVNTALDHKLQVCFNTGRPIHTVNVQNHFSVINRCYDPYYTEGHDAPAEKLKELKTNTGPVEKFVCANGLAIIPKYLTEYEVRHNSLCLTLVRSVGWLSRGDIDSRGGFAGPPLETPQAQCLRSFITEYAFYPSDSITQLYKESQEYLYKPLCEMGNGASTTLDTSSLLLWENHHIVSTCMKSMDQSGKILIRLLNTSSSEIALPITFNTRITEYTLCSLEEVPVSPPQNITETTILTFTPFQLITLILTYTPLSSCK